MNNEDIKSNGKEVKETKEKNKKIDILPAIICILFAVVIWYYVMQVDSPDYQEVFYDIDVSLSNTSLLENERNLYVYSGYGYTVDVTVSGKKSVISKYTAEDITVSADLKDIMTAGEYEVALQVKLPSGLTLADKGYNSINVYVDEKETVSLIVKPKVTGVTYSGEYEYGELIPEYDSVVAHGPKTEIEKLDSAIVSVDLSSLGVIKETTTSVCQVSIVNKDGETVSNPYIKLSRSEMKVTLPVYTYKDLQLKVDFMHGVLNDKNSKVTISPSKVRVKGDPEVLEKYTSIIVATVDEKSMSGDTVSSYQLETYEDFTYEDATDVEVKIEHIGTATKTFSVSNIEVSKGKNECSLIDKSVDVTLRGTPEQLEDMTSDDIVLKIDVSEYASDYSGTAKVPAVVFVSGENADGVYELNSYSVQVEVN